MTFSFHWHTKHAQEFVFFIRYPKEKKTGYTYEPWHLR
ncbi:D-alanyl-D-alanine carboxypeptidase family protein [Bacillus zhangzhouensis]